MDVPLVTNQPTLVAVLFGTASHTSLIAVMDTILVTIVLAMRYMYEGRVTRICDLP